MKRIMVTLVMVILLITGCAPSAEDAASGDVGRFKYFHDETHEVGIWWDSMSGGIAILPDGDYYNVGVPIEGGNQ